MAKATTERAKIFTFICNYKPGLLIFSPIADEIVNPVGDRFDVILRASDADPDPENPRLGSSPYNTMYFAIRARVYRAGAQLGPEEGWQDPVRGNYLPEVGAYFPYTPEIKLDIAVL